MIVFGIIQLQPEPTEQSRLLTVPDESTIEIPQGAQTFRLESFGGRTCIRVTASNTAWKDYDDAIAWKKLKISKPAKNAVLIQTKWSPKDFADAMLQDWDGETPIRRYRP